jgi:hypothetical protein
VPALSENFDVSRREHSLCYKKYTRVHVIGILGWASSGLFSIQLLVTPLFPSTTNTMNAIQKTNQAFMQEIIEALNGKGPSQK